MICICVHARCDHFTLRGRWVLRAYALCRWVHRAHAFLTEVHRAHRCILCALRSIWVTPVSANLGYRNVLSEVHLGVCMHCCVQRSEQPVHLCALDAPLHLLYM